MKDLDIEQRFHLMQKEIEASVAVMNQANINLRATVDSLKIELEVMKIYMERLQPGFILSYPKLREEAIQAIDPEWDGSDAAAKIDS